ncbi:MAG: hypothetical protein GWP05_06485 [Anaerolineaceae bacterium]|nr:hypothetical protein [Anaerolineaceae bacterium]
MKKRIALVLTLVVLLAGPAGAQQDPAAPPAAPDAAPTPDPDAPPKAATPGLRTMADLLSAMPEQTRSFFVVADVGEVAAKAVLFQQRTGLELPIKDKSISDLIRVKIGLRGGVVERGATGIAYLDPVVFSGRNTVFAVPVQGLEQFLEYNAAELVEKGLYQMTETSEPRFFTHRGGYALFTDSLRTCRAVRDGKPGLADRLTAEQKEAIGKSDLYLHVDMLRTMESRRKTTERFRRSTATKIMGDPTLYAYSDILLGYMNAVNSLFEQLESFDVGLRLGADDLGLSVIFQFTEGGSLYRHLLDMGGGRGSLVGDLPLDLPYISARGINLNPDMIQLASLNVVDFLLLNSPQADKKVRPDTRDMLLDATGELTGGLTGQISSMISLPDPASGAYEANLAVLRVKDTDQFNDAVQDFFGTLLKVSDEIGSRVLFLYKPEQEEYREVKIAYLEPKIEFTRRRFKQLFEERARKVYGPDGYRYRLAFLEGRMIVCSGSDLTLFHAAIDRVLDEKKAAPESQIAEARQGLPEVRNIEYYVNLPAMLSRTLLLSGPAGGASRRPIEFNDEDRKFIESQGIVGLAVGLDKGRIRLDASVGYDQLGQAVKFAKRFLPPIRPEAPTPEPTEEPGPTPEPVPAEPPAPTQPEGFPKEPAPAPGPGGTP